MSDRDQRPTRTHTEITTNTGVALTLADLRDFLGRADQAGIPDTAVPTVRTTWSGGLKRIAAKGEPTDG